MVIRFQRVPGISNPHLLQSTRVTGTKLKRVHQDLAEEVEPREFWPWFKKKKDKVWWKQGLAAGNQRSRHCCSFAKGLREQNINGGWLAAVDPVATSFGTIGGATGADAPQVPRYLGFNPTGCKYSMRIKSIRNKTRCTSFSRLTLITDNCLKL